jgi:hypothetical protein
MERMNQIKSGYLELGIPGELSNSPPFSGSRNALLIFHGGQFRPAFPLTPGFLIKQVSAAQLSFPSPNGDSTFVAPYSY